MAMEDKLGRFLGYAGNICGGNTLGFDYSIFRSECRPIRAGTGATYNDIRYIVVSENERIAYGSLMWGYRPTSGHNPITWTKFL